MTSISLERSEDLATSPVDVSVGLRSVAQAKRDSIEFVRFASCIAVLWFHCEAPGASIGFAGLPALLMTSIALTSRPTRSEPAIEVIVRRARRLLTPWICWSVIYAVCRSAGASQARLDPFVWWRPWMLWTGCSIHLWYLPYAFLVTSILAVLRPRPADASVVTIISRCAMIIASIGFSSWWLSTSTHVVPFDQWICCLPAVTMGLALPPVNHNGPLATVALISTLGTALSLYAISNIVGWNALSLPYVLAIIAVVTAWRLASQTGGALASSLGRLSFGIYLIHPLFIHILKRSAFLDPASLCLVVIVCSAVSTIVLQKTPLRFLTE